MNSRVFVRDDQLAFAALSRDFNPVHVDENAARRTMFGRPIVHGMHIALWMLDWFTADGATPLPFRKLSARFNRPLFLEERATVHVKQGERGVELHCTSGGTLLTQLKLAEAGALEPLPWRPGDASWSTTPVVLDEASLADARGSLELPYTTADMERLFPQALRLYGAAALAHLIALTRIVGMELPGLHSLFGGFSIEFRGMAALASTPGVATAGPSGGDASNARSSRCLEFATSRFNAKTSHLQITVTGDVLGGTIDTFVRPRSSATDYGAVTTAVRRGEFAGRRCLIVGGSRGLGLVCAYLLAAGGAAVALTYRVGREEAEAGVASIREAGGEALAVPLDVAEPAAGFAALAEQGFTPTEVYYFATPHIFERKKALFEPEIFQRFVKCYVTDFHAIIDSCLTLSAGRVTVFYPSSDALNHPVKELMEYSAAKAAAEHFSELMSQFNPRVRIVQARLPRLPTDQTATLMKIAAAEPAEIMLTICRSLGEPHG